MSERYINGLNAAFNSGACTASGAAATLTVVTAVTFTVKGVWGTAVSAAAKTLAFVTTSGVASSSTTGYASATAEALYGGASTNANAPSGNQGQACILLHCADAAGAVKTLQGKKVQLDGSGNLMSALEFPTPPDTLTPFCYQVCKIGSTGSDWTPGTSNWNATGATNTIVQISTLPKRPYFA